MRQLVDSWQVQTALNDQLDLDSILHTEIVRKSCRGPLIATIKTELIWGIEDVTWLGLNVEVENNLMREVESRQ